MIAGSVAARRAVREEIDELRSLLLDGRTALPCVEPRPAALSRDRRLRLLEPALRSRPAPVVEEGISPEILMVLSAAVAAFLGKRARIRRAQASCPRRALVPGRSRGACSCRRRTICRCITGRGGPPADARGSVAR